MDERIVGIDVDFKEDYVFFCLRFVLILFKYVDDCFWCFYFNYIIGDN